MKIALLAAMLGAVGLFFLDVAGCATETPGADYTLGTYTTMVDSTPDKVTDAARKSADDLKLNNVVANGTKVDGNVIADNAQGDKIEIDVVQAGENVSKVTIHVGASGDEAVSRQLVEGIKSHLKWF